MMVSSEHDIAMIMDCFRQFPVVGIVGARQVVESLAGRIIYHELRGFPFGGTAPKSRSSLNVHKRMQWFIHR
jgi:hypothetical protein